VVATLVGLPNVFVDAKDVKSELPSNPEPVTTGTSVIANPPGVIVGNI